MPDHEQLLVKGTNKIIRPGARTFRSTAMHELHRASIGLGIGSQLKGCGEPKKKPERPSDKGAS
jgi:hypothetical protein